VRQNAAFDAPPWAHCRPVNIQSILQDRLSWEPRKDRMPLDISSFEKAITRLAEGMARYQQNVADDQIRDSLIRRFEFTYELGHKMLKRYLEAASATPAQYDAMPFQDLIRSANEQGLLLGDWPAWR